MGTIIIILIIAIFIFIVIKILNPKEMKEIINLEREEKTNTIKISSLEAKFGDIPLGLTQEETIALLIEHKIIPERYDYSDSNYITINNDYIQLEYINDLVYKIIYKYNSWLKYSDIKDGLIFKYGKGQEPCNPLYQYYTWENNIVKIVLDYSRYTGISITYLDKNLYALKLKDDEEIRINKLKELTKIL